MSGIAPNGSQWITAVEIGGLVMFTFAGAAVGGLILSNRADREIERQIEAAQRGIALETNNTKRRRRYSASAETSATLDDARVEELTPLNVIEDFDPDFTP